MKETNVLVRFGLLRRNSAVPGRTQAPTPVAPPQSSTASSRPAAAPATQSAAQPATVRASQPAWSQQVQPQPDTASPGQGASVPPLTGQLTTTGPAVQTEVLAARPVGYDIGTVMPSGAKFSGDIEIEESIVLKCVVRGNVTQTGPHQVILAGTGGIHGTLRAMTAVIAGTVEGDVYVDELVVLATGKIEGNVRYCKLTVEEGGVINGDTRCIVANVVGDAGPDTGSNDVRRAALQDAGGLHAVLRPDLPRQENQERAA